MEFNYLFVNFLYLFLNRLKFVLGCLKSVFNAFEIKIKNVFIIKKNPTFAPPIRLARLLNKND
jgi:hypothetical protein